MNSNSLLFDYLAATFSICTFIYNFIHILNNSILRTSVTECRINLKIYTKRFV